jgi:hypothetical protein
MDDLTTIVAGAVATLLAISNMSFTIMDSLLVPWAAATAMDARSKSILDTLVARSTDATAIYDMTTRPTMMNHDSLPHLRTVCYV